MLKSLQTACFVQNSKSLLYIIVVEGERNQKMFRLKILA